MNIAKCLGTRTASLILALVDKINMVSKNISILSLIALVVLFFYFYDYRLDTKFNELKNSYKITSGSFAGRLSSNPRSSLHDYYANYFFYVNNHKYEGVYVGDNRILTKKDFVVITSNHNFPIIYSNKNILNNQLLLLPKDFIKYNFTYPDSMKWILSFLK